MSGGNSILLFRILLKFMKIRGSNFFKRNLILAPGDSILASGNGPLNKFLIPHSVDEFSVLWKPILLI